MATVTRRYCKLCRADGPATRSHVSHLLHLVISILTFGLWIPIWILVSLSATWNCTTCGARTYASWWTAPNYGLAAIVAIVAAIIYVITALK